MNLYGISGCSFMLLLCVAILLASHYEDHVRDFVVTRFLGPIAAPCPEEDDDYDRF